MGFLAPAFLAGLLGVALPVYLHLLRKQQEEPTPFSTLMFLEKTEQMHTRRKQLRYLLLFSLRTLLVLLLALIFAQPFYRQPAQTVQADRILVLALDGSLSMMRKDNAEAARRQALAVVNTNPGKATQVLSFARGASLLTPVTTDASALRDAIRAWKPAPSAGSFAELKQAAVSIHANEKKPLDLHVFSDFQASAMPATFEETQLPPGTRFTEHIVGDPADNWAVDTVVAPARVAPLSKVDVRASITSYAQADRELPVSVWFGDRKVAEKQVSVKAGERVSVEFAGLQPGPRFTRAEIRIGVEDGMEPDNRFYFVIEKTDLQTVAFVSGVTVNLSAKYMETALAAIPNTLFRFQMLAPAQLNSDNIRSFAYVVIDGAPGVFSSVGADLQRFVRGGGSLLILLPRSATPGNEIPVIDATLRSASQGTERGELRIDTLEPSHPVLEGLDALRTIRFLHAWNLQGEDLQTLASLGDGTPVLLEKRIGEGRVLVMTSSLDSASNDLPFHPLFVPMVERVSRYLSGLIARPASRHVDDFLELRIPGSMGAGTGFEVTGPEGVRLLSTSDSLETDGVVLDRPGFYSVNRVGGRQELVAANVDTVESSLARLDETRISLWKASGEEAAPATLAQGGEENERRIPFGWYGFLILAAVLIGESWIANRFWRKSATEVL